MYISIYVCMYVCMFGFFSPFRVRKWRDEVDNDENIAYSTSGQKSLM